MHCAFGTGGNPGMREFTNVSVHVPTGFVNDWQGWKGNPQRLTSGGCSGHVLKKKKRRVQLVFLSGLQSSAISCAQTALG